jgi:Chaperone of endosialidase
VSWEWRPGAPVEAHGREAGVIAQEVQAVFPELVKTGSDGYLRVDYGGLTTRLGDAVVELADRLDRLEFGAAEPELSDGGAKREVEPVQRALARLRSGGRLDRADSTALVGALVEAVKELDTRLTSLEQSRAHERD